MRIPLSTLFLILPYLVSEAAALPSLRRPRVFKRAGGDVEHQWGDHEPYAEESAATASYAEVLSASASASTEPEQVSASASAIASAPALESASVSLASAVDPSYTGIPVASESANPSDYLPFSETARTLIPLSDVPSSSISSLLAETSKFSTFTFTDYQPTETQWASETQAGPTQAPAPAPTASWDSDSDSGTGDNQDAKNKGLLRQALGGIQSYAESLIGAVMPTVTFEVVLQPTQVSVFSLFL
jgi:hypothetical protein